MPSLACSCSYCVKGMYWRALFRERTRPHLARIRSFCVVQLCLLFCRKRVSSVRGSRPKKVSSKFLLECMRLVVYTISTRATRELSAYFFGIFVRSFSCAYRGFRPSSSRATALVHDSGVRTGGRVFRERSLRIWARRSRGWERGRRIAPKHGM